MPAILRLGFGPLLACAVLLAAGSGPAGAQAGGERIRDYRVVLEVRASGDLAVTEEIDYDFGAGERHGILRDIPVGLRYDDRYDRRYPVEDLTVRASPGTPDQLRTETSGGRLHLRIGDPDRTVTGRHGYVISYRVRAALNGFDDHDELYWNAIGADWTVPVDRAAVTVVTPGPITAVACFAGPSGSRLPCAEAGHDPGDAAADAPAGGGAGPAQARFAHSNLDAHEALTVVVGIAKGHVPEPAPVLEERWSFARAFSVTPGTVAPALVLLAAVVAGFARLAWRTGRDRRYVGSPVDIVFGTAHGRHQAVPLFESTVTPVEFEPPEGLRPGQVGTLVDESAETLDVSATIVDLAVRGFLSIEEIPKEGLFGKRDWRLVRLDGTGRQSLKTYERLLLDGLFEGGPEVELSDLRDRFAARLKRVQDALYDDAVAMGWFATRPDRTRRRWVLIGGAVLAAASALVWLAAARTRFGIVPIPLVAGGLLVVAGARFMPQRTAKGTAALRRVQGFRRFIVESERERARFAERRHLFSEYLPYAVVFGATRQWARTFAGLEGDGELPATSWYRSPHPFSARRFSDSVDGFAVATSGVLASTPSGSGSSGFGGGGSSGGGGGGGGGGSW